MLETLEKIEKLNPEYQFRYFGYTSPTHLDERFEEWVKKAERCISASFWDISVDMFQTGNTIIRK